MRHCVEAGFHRTAGRTALLRTTGHTAPHGQQAYPEQLRISFFTFMEKFKRNHHCPKDQNAYPERPLWPVGGVILWLGAQPRPNQVEEVGQQPGMGQPRQALLAHITH